MGRLLWLLPLSLGLLPVALLLSAPKRTRTRTIPPEQERVLIIGASSGIGREIAHVYAARGARVCIVARREDKLDAVRAECVALFHGEENRTLKAIADFADPEALLRVRALLDAEWQGVDTLVVNAGVSALQPLLAVAGAADVARSDMPSLDGLTRVHDVADAALHGNFTGPLLSATTFIPMLTHTSRSPAILLVSSVAALIPAPTRTLYGASKAAALILFRSLAIEHPLIRFTSIIPATIEGDFRASAVDGGPVRETLSASNVLRKEHVARACVHAVDKRLRTLWLPAPYRFAHLLSLIFPSLVDAAARRKYNFH